MNRPPIRSYGVAAHHGGLSIHRPGFEFRYEHLKLEFNSTVAILMCHASVAGAWATGAPSILLIRQRSMR